MREFGDALKAADGSDLSEEEPLAIGVLGREILIEYPGSSQLSYLAATMSIAASPLDAVGSVINFIVALVDDDDGRYLQRVLLNPKSGFDVEDLAEIAEYMIEEWSGNPTNESSVSSRRPATTGRSSTAKQRASQSSRSRSRSGASSTGSTPAS